jgi:hypothetical protein
MLPSITITIPSGETSGSITQTFSYQSTLTVGRKHRFVFNGVRLPSMHPHTDATKSEVLMKSMGATGTNNTLYSIGSFSP